MDRNEPAAKRVKLDRTCKTKRSDDLLTKPSPSSKAVNDVKRKCPKVTSNAAGIEPKSTSSHTKTGPLQLTELNVYCLIEIMGYLNLGDICAVAEVCVVLKEVALKTFISKYGEQIRLGSLTIPSVHTCTLVKIRRLLYNFGHLIRSLAIQFDLLGPISYKKLLVLIRKYCFDTIKNVVVWNEPISEEYLNFTGRIFLNGNFSVEIFNSKVIYRNKLVKQTR